MEAEARTNPRDKLKAAEAHLERVRTLYGFFDRHIYYEWLHDGAADFYLADAKTGALEAAAKTDNLALLSARRQRADAAERWYHAISGEPGDDGIVYLTSLLELSRNSLEAALAGTDEQAKQLAAAQEYQKRVRELTPRLKATALRIDVQEALWTADYFLKDSAIAVAAQSKASASTRKLAELRLQDTQAVYDLRVSDLSLSSVEWYYLWSGRWRDAALALAADKPARIAAARDHLERMRALRRAFEGMAQRSQIILATDDDLATTFYRAEAEVLLKEAERR